MFHKLCVQWKMKWLQSSKKKKKKVSIDVRRLKFEFLNYSTKNVVKCLLLLFSCKGLSIYVSSFCYHFCTLIAQEDKIVIIQTWELYSRVSIANWIRMADTTRTFRLFIICKPRNKNIFYYYPSKRSLFNPHYLAFVSHDFL